MKYIVVIFLSVGMVFSIQAQNTNYRSLAEETCACVQKQNLAKASKKEWEMAIGLCMFEAMKNQKVEAQLSDATELEKIAEKVGFEMATICPAVFQGFAGLEEKQSDVQAVSGKVKSVEQGEFLTITVREESGREHKLLWLRYFPGSDPFKDDPKKLVGKKVQVAFHVFEAYMPKSKLYVNQKEIIELVLE